jgi:multimeric flavodoxin WrbA
MGFKVVGISGSPVKDGNVESFLQVMMDHAAEKGLDSDSVHLSRLDVRECIHCNFCLSKQQPGKYCALEDDAQEVFEKIERADIIVLASPVYFMRTSAKMSALIDRLRIFAFGNLVRGRLKNKIGVSSAVSWLRHGGMETTHLTHLYAFMILEMIPVGGHQSVCPLGASAVASKNGLGDFDPAVRLGVMEDAAGLHSARAMMERAIGLAGLIPR